MKFTSAGKKKFIEKWESRYFKDSPADVIPNNHKIEKSFEKRIDNILSKTEPYSCEDLAYAIGWKMGYSNSEVIEKALEHDKWHNGYGRTISELNGYIEFLVSKQSEIKGYLEEYKRENVKDAYMILTREKTPPVYFGSVYLINVLYFISKREIPIYDNFAHKAVKALEFKKNPWEIFVGGMPSKDKEDDVLNLLDEYVFYLEDLFGKHKIERDLDRALWVYGHLKEKEKSLLSE